MYSLSLAKRITYEQYTDHIFDFHIEYMVHTLSIYDQYIDDTLLIYHQYITSTWTFYGSISIRSFLLGIVPEKWHFVNSK